MTAQTILFIILAYFTMLMFIAFLGRKETSNTAFFLGNKKSPWYVVSFGMLGASLSGVSFVSVPGWVGSSGFTYMQMVLGFSCGYIIVAKILLPIYYRLNVTSIYEYLQTRFGITSYKTGTLFFLLSRTIGGATRLYIVALILQTLVFEAWNIPFFVTVLLLIVPIYLYTFINGIKTIIWTDALQTFFLLGALILLVVQACDMLNFNFDSAFSAIKGSHFSQIFVFDDWKTSSNFFKMFLSGVFVTIAMTGLDQDMMQKNLSCKNLKEAQKNMYYYGFAFIPINLIFLSLGALLLMLAQQYNIVLPTHSDEILPTLVSQGFLGEWAMFFFVIGIISATFSSADSALVSLTTAFSVDILEVNKKSEKSAKRIRQIVHICMCLCFALIVFLFRTVNDKNIIDLLYTIASYTYGPLLGLFAFGIFTKKGLRDKYVPFIAIASPIICYALQLSCKNFLNYNFGYELLIVNGFFTFVGLLAISKKKNRLAFNTNIHF